MPYFSIKDLQEKLQEILPKGAQELYRRAFNKVWDQFHDPKKLPKVSLV